MKKRFFKVVALLLTATMPLSMFVSADDATGSEVSDLYPAYDLGGGDFNCTASQ